MSQGSWIDIPKVDDQKQQQLHCGNTQLQETQWEDLDCDGQQMELLDIDKQNQMNDILNDVDMVDEDDNKNDHQPDDKDPQPELELPQDPQEQLQMPAEPTIELTTDPAADPLQGDQNNQENVDQEIIDQNIKLNHESIEAIEAEVKAVAQAIEAMEVEAANEMNREQAKAVQVQSEALQEGQQSPIGSQDKREEKPDQTVSQPVSEGKASSFQADSQGKTDSQEKEKSQESKEVMAKVNENQGEQKKQIKQVKNSSSNRKKDPKSNISRAQTAWGFYITEQRNTDVFKQQGVNKDDLTAEFANKFREFNPETMKKYMDMEMADRQRYSKELEAFREVKKKKCIKYLEQYLQEKPNAQDSEFLNTLQLTSAIASNCNNQLEFPSLLPQQEIITPPIQNQNIENKVISSKFESKLLSMLYEVSLNYYMQMPMYFKKLVSPDNPLLPYYQSLLASFARHDQVPENHKQIWLHISGVGLTCPHDCREMFSTQFLLKDHLKVHKSNNKQWPIKLNQWYENQLFCPMGCIEAESSIDMARHLAEHQNSELQPWLLTQEKLKIFIKSQSSQQSGKTSKLGSKVEQKEQARTRQSSLPSKDDSEFYKFEMKRLREDMEEVKKEQKIMKAEQEEWKSDRKRERKAADKASEKDGRSSRNSQEQIQEQILQLGEFAKNANAQIRQQTMMPPMNPYMFMPYQQPMIPPPFFDQGLQQPPYIPYQQPSPHPLPPQPQQPAFGQTGPVQDQQKAISQRTSASPETFSKDDAYTPPAQPQKVILQPKPVLKVPQQAKSQNRNSRKSRSSKPPLQSLNKLQINKPAVQSRISKGKLVNQNDLQIHKITPQKPKQPEHQPIQINNFMMEHSDNNQQMIVQELMQDPNQDTVGISMNQLEAEMAEASLKANQLLQNLDISNTKEALNMPIKEDEEAPQMDINEQVMQDNFSDTASQDSAGKQAEQASKFAEQAELKALKKVRKTKKVVVPPAPVAPKLSPIQAHIPVQMPKVIPLQQQRPTENVEKVEEIVDLQQVKVKCPICGNKFAAHATMMNHLRATHTNLSAKFENLSPAETKYFEGELKRLALEIHSFRYGPEATVNKTRIKNYKRTLRVRIANGEYVPGYKSYKVWLKKQNKIKNRKQQQQ